MQRDTRSLVREFNGIISGLYRFLPTVPADKDSSVITLLDRIEVMHAALIETIDEISCVKDDLIETGVAVGELKFKE
jgi:hypothetical protein